MFYHDLDDLPAQYPEHLILIDESQFNELKQDKKNSGFLLAKDKHYLIVPSIQEAQNHPITKELANQNNLKPNTLLLLNEDEGVKRYLSYDVLIEKSLEFQMLQFTELCQHLGAKKVELIYEASSNEKSKTSAEASTTIKSANVGARASHQNESLNNAKTSKLSTFDGKHINLTKAEELMKTGIFDGNNPVIAFYNTARNQTNKMQTQHIEFSASQKLTKQLKAFANADVPFLKTIANAEFEREVEQVQSWKVAYKVEF
ncbi:hypothetical protein AO371_1438 [Moraxella catarrhalis]|uniref:hypothetical protein n=1 Tax=Moraxella catarrhalis TaxID=480 RepID=UPI0007E308C7|nr:hypothetical protein [Moraxella catarrhalis]OAV23171.1 hypothetical protein AO371_1438 [Moraxella catarrhalis]